ncbi:MAG: hypothetical protein Q7T61_20480 [Caulobacter sp.]|nr:hypothetical protein [Caulobacter sp.]
MADFPAVFELSSLDGANGFRIDGVAADDRSSWTVASAGDVNDDGYIDLIIGAPYTDWNGAASGSAYIVFGKGTGFTASLSLADLDGANGFRIDGAVSNEVIGHTISPAGDINKDGFDDVIVGGIWASPNGNAIAGVSYVVFGGSAFTATLAASSLDGGNGFRIPGIAPNDRTGSVVSGAGDINGDGYADFAIGGYGVDSNGDYAGASYVVFGKANGFTADFDLAGLDGANGFRIDGAAPGHRNGRPIASAGDINGDGYDDLVVVSSNASPNGINSGAAYVVFGKSSGFGASLSVANLDGSNGFRLPGQVQNEGLGTAVSSAGDVNGDGYDDLIIGAPGLSNGRGGAYVIFGKATGFTADFDQSTLDGANGFRIDGAGAYQAAGTAVSSGDVNGDGYSDLIIGSYRTDVHGSLTGSTYVIYGKASGFAATLALSSLDGVNGFRIDGVAGGDLSSRWLSAGDMNGDGVDDIMISGEGADPVGSFSGSTYVVFGVQAAIVRSGDLANDNISGRSAGDTLSGAGGNDVLYGMAGDDLLDGGDLSDQLFGGDGADDLLGGGGGDVLYGDAGDDQIDGGEGHDKLFGGLGADTLIGGLGNDRFDGGDGIDTLNGGAGNDYLDGGLGADIMRGGAENDIYLVDDLGDQVIELSGEGYDVVRTELDGWVLGANIEALELGGTADIGGAGNALANIMQGNSGANSLSGGEGNDTLYGLDGADTLIGGLGGDILWGGAGADTFVVAHTFSGALETDNIKDFSILELDRLDLSGAYIGTLEKVDAFDKHAGQMTLTFAAGITTLKLDVNGDGKADYQLRINGDVTGESGNWSL